MPRQKRRSRKVDAQNRVDTSRVDREALATLASISISRDQLQGDGYCPMNASSDLHPYGYTVRHWILAGKAQSEVLEYNPSLSDLPRLTATCYDEQAAIHRALGLNLVSPGERWVNYQQTGLFDGILTP